MTPTIGFFTRVLDRTSAPERYRIALEQIELAERLGYESAWVAQHHLDGAEGGLPSPFVLLAAAAARTQRHRRGPAILTLGLLSGGVLLLAVVLIEAVALRLLRWATFWRALRDGPSTGS